ncbi:ribonuclease H-like domain-containing protein [Tanacetum coccineum]|uniref:Ribonuclease H-like domain-containing protein n=1 Tax=Tanacetum coccineum TaxID=301880 RepID=A0ABQ5BED4_9ASTR
MGYYFYFPPENKIVVARYVEFFEKRLISQEISGRAVDLEEIQEEEDTTPLKSLSSIFLKRWRGFEPPQVEVISDSSELIVDCDMECGNPIHDGQYGMGLDGPSSWLYCDPNHPRKVCKLQRSIYGLKQASSIWNKRFDEESKGPSCMRFGALRLDCCVTPNMTSDFNRIQLNAIAMLDSKMIEMTLKSQTGICFRFEWRASGLEEFKQRLGIVPTINVLEYVTATIQLQFIYAMTREFRIGALTVTFKERISLLFDECVGAYGCILAGPSALKQVHNPSWPKYQSTAGGTSILVFTCVQTDDLQESNWNMGYWSGRPLLAEKKGNTVNAGIDFDEDPLVRFRSNRATIRTVLESLAVTRDWHILQIDVKNAFLHGRYLRHSTCIHTPGSKSGLFCLSIKLQRKFLRRSHLQHCNQCKSTQLYTDVDWAGCPVTRRSTFGYCVFLGDNLLSWSAKWQVTLSRSSAEAEYRGVANVVAETAWIRNLLLELHTPSLLLLLSIVIMFVCFMSLPDFSMQIFLLRVSPQLCFLGVFAPAARPEDLRSH